jgi:hypothetical protein
MAKRLLLAAAVTAAALPGCSDDLGPETALRPSFIRTDISILDTTVTAVSGSTFLQRLAMNGRQNLLGRYGTLEARTLLQFSFGAFPRRDTVQVISATLTLRAETRLGPQGTLAFTAHRILQAWNEATVRSDSAFLPAVEYSIVRGSYSGSVAADTQYITIDLDTAMVREWLRPSAPAQYGLMLVPTAASTVLRGFHVFDFDSVRFLPNLLVVTRGVQGGVLDTGRFAGGIDTFVGSAEAPPAGSATLLLQSGVGFRSTLFFDVGFIPRGSTVVQADLALVRDPAQTLLTTPTRDTLISAHVRLSASDSSTFEVVSAPGRPSTTFPGTFALDLRHAVQSWAIGPNNGLLLRAASGSEFNTMDRFAFFGPGATNPAQRPLLRIFYTVRREETNP